jgi:uncharacterized phage protein gp47/JayE
MKPTKKSIKKQLEELQAAVKTYTAAVQGRQGYLHSNTAATKETNGVKGLVTIQVAELNTIVKTANILKKHVTLETRGDNLNIQLVDRYPALPYEFTRLV